MKQSKSFELIRWVVIFIVLAGAVRAFQTADKVLWILGVLLLVTAIGFYKKFRWAPLLFVLINVGAGIQWFPQAGQANVYEKAATCFSIILNIALATRLYRDFSKKDTVVPLAWS